MLLTDTSSPKSCQRTLRYGNSKTAIYVPNPPSCVSYFLFMRHFWNCLPVSYGGTLRSFYSIFPAEFYQFSGIPSTVLPLHAYTHTSPHDRYVFCTDTPKICATILPWRGTKCIWIQKIMKKKNPLDCVDIQLTLRIFITMGNLS